MGAFIDKFLAWLRCFLPLLFYFFRGLVIVIRAYFKREPDDDSPFLRLGWELDAGTYDLPAWVDANRVHGSSPHPIKRYFGKPAFALAASAFKTLGASVFMRHVKSHDEDPWWPTAVPVKPDGSPAWDGALIHQDNVNPDECSLYFTIPAGTPDIVQSMVDEAESAGLKLIAYYRHMTECRIAKSHPQWICKDIEDHSVKLKEPWRGYHLDLTSPFRDIVLQRLLELAEKGVSGFNFDYRHLPPAGCWTETLEAEFERITGSTIPTIKNEVDSLYRQLLDFQAYKMEETFAFWRREVRKRFPHITFSISTTSIPSLINRRMTTNLARIADSAKNEYHLAWQERLNSPMETRPTVFERFGLVEPEKDIRMAFGWVLLRDSCEGRPPQIWAPNFPDKNHAYAFAASLVTYGTIARMHVHESVLHDVITGKTTAPSWATPRAGLEAAFQLGNKVSPYLSGTQPLRWAAVHFSELARNRRKDKLDRAWSEVLWPASGAFAGFVRERLPVDIINDYQLEKGQIKGYKLLFLPNPDELTEGQKRTVARFALRGGILIKNNPVWRWSEPSGTEEAVRAFSKELRRIMKCFPPPVQVAGGPERMHAVVFEHRSARRLIIALTNDFTWVQTQTRKNPLDPSEVNPPPAPISDAEVIVKRRRRPGHVFEVLSDTLLTAVSISRGYKVRLPEFQTMALLVIEE